MEAVIATYGYLAVLIGTSGCLFGNAVETVIADVKHYELGVFVLVGIAGCFVWFLHLRGRKKGYLGR